MKILLDYVFPISVITPTPAASTGFLKRAALVCMPKAGQEGNVGELYACNNMTEVAARTDNTEAQQLFNAGLSQVFILLAIDLDLADYLETHKGEFFTLLISSDFQDGDIESGNVTAAVKATLKVQDLTYTAKTAGLAGNDITIAYVDGGTAGSESVDVTGTDIEVTIEDGVSTAENILDAIEASVPAAALVDVVVDEGDEDDVQSIFAETPLAGGDDAGTGDGLQTGTFDGVIGLSSDDAEFCAEQVALTNRCAFFTNSTNKAKNMCFAFGSLLSSPSNWRNQQYISMPFNDGVDELGEANALFDDKVSFVIHDDEFGNRLALFSVQGKAIVAPYILKNLRVDMQSRALQWISQNQPQYTIKEASLLETRLQEDVINSYIARTWIESGNVEIEVVQANFVADGTITVPQPKALWRVFSEMTETV